MDGIDPFSTGVVGTSHAICCGDDGLGNVGNLDGKDTFRKTLDPEKPY